jgi:hypothetical protein
MHTQSVYNKTQIYVCSLPETAAFFIGEISPKKKKEKMEVYFEVFNCQK